MAGHDLEPTEGITGVNRNLGFAMLRHETTLRVTHWFDADGDDCEPDAAVSCVAGDNTHGWWSIDLSAYSRTNVN